jgi:hypothetical protein
VVHPFASHHEGTGFNPQGVLSETGILLLALSRYNALLTNCFLKSCHTIKVQQYNVIWLEQRENKFYVDVCAYFV